jgi:hypothetical protein
MRRLAVGICVAAALFGGCAKKTPTATAPPSTASAVSAAEPKTPQQLKAIAQLHFNSFSVGDFDSFWDDFDADAQRTISKAEYVKRLTACMKNDPNRNKPFRVVNVIDNKNDTWTVEVNYTKYRIKFPARYENGHWKFSLSADAKRALKLPMDQYLSTQCAK